MTEKTNNTSLRQDESGHDTFEEFFGDLPATSVPPAATVPTRVQAAAPSPHADPRPDLPGSLLWTKLLGVAFLEDGDAFEGLFGSLHGLRCADAARLLLARDGGLRLIAAPGREGEYAAYRERYLAPHAAALGGLLASITV